MVMGEGATLRAFMPATLRSAAVADRPLLVGSSSDVSKRPGEDKAISAADRHARTQLHNTRSSKFVWDLLGAGQARQLIQCLSSALTQSASTSFENPVGGLVAEHLAEPPYRMQGRPLLRFGAKCLRQVLARHEC